MTRLVGFFIDDIRPLEVPFELKDLDITWYVFRDLRQLRQSDIFDSVRAHYVCFDYYLERGVTGLDFIYEILSEYKEKSWSLPIASFHSSDPSCNQKMLNIWKKMGGETIYDTPEQKPIVRVSLADSTKTKVTGVAKYFRRNKK